MFSFLSRFKKGSRKEDFQGTKLQEVSLAQVMADGLNKTAPAFHKEMKEKGFESYQ